jgi:5'(3')-deoxyribonucleotidase
MNVTVLLDVDGVLVDLATPVWTAAQEILDKPLPPPREWVTYDFDKAMGLSPSQATRVYNMLRKRDNLAAQAQWYPGAVEFVRKLIDHGYDVCFVTKPWAEMASWQKDREHQLKESFPQQEFMFTGHKRRIIGHFLLDDCVDHIRQDPARGLLFDRPWNRDVKGYRRVYDYEHAFKRMTYGEMNEDTEITELGCCSISSEPTPAKTTKRAGVHR